MSQVTVFIGDELARYGFGEGHPFGPDRLGVFEKRYREMGLDGLVREARPQAASENDLLRFHSGDYIDRLKALSKAGSGYLDAGDTPAYPGIYEASLTVVGTGLAALRSIMNGESQRAFIPIAGLHHARRNSASGFCAVNDCGVLIETLLGEYGLRNLAYVDIDAHHGDGVFYAFESDPRVLFADIHEDGRYLYPGTGSIDETGKGEAAGKKLNLPAPPNSDDVVFDIYWEKVEVYLEQHQPEFILLQCGADSVAGDPITHMQFTPAAHGKAASRLCRIADRFAEGRLLAMGGGGYNRENLARAWTSVVKSLVDGSA